MKHLIFWRMQGCGNNEMRMKHVIRGGLLILLLSIFLALASASTLQVTEEHPFLLNGEWVEARELETGDLLTTVDGGLVRITRITRVEPPEPILVYNLEAGVFHDFVVGKLGLVVHNSNNEVQKLVSAGKNAKTPMVYERYWSRFEATERIALGPPDEQLATIARDVHADTFGKLPKNPDEKTLWDTARKASTELRRRLPFLGQSSIDRFEVITEYNPADTFWRRYLNHFKTGPVPLGDLGAADMLDCTGQDLTIMMAIREQDSNWRLYNDMFWDHTSEAYARRHHTFLAKDYGEVIVIVDPSESSGAKLYTWKPEEFYEKYANAEIPLAM